MNISLTKITSKEKQYLRFSATVFNKTGIAVSQKTGFIEVQPELAELALESFNSGESKAEFGAFNETTKLYDMILLDEASNPVSVEVGELAHSEA